MSGTVLRCSCPSGLLVGALLLVCVLSAADRLLAQTRPAPAASAATTLAPELTTRPSTKPAANQPKLPPLFVYLRDIDPSIQQDMRYYGRHNFLGRRVKGYLAPECILTRPAALALKRVQARLLKRRLSLKVYDCYRPARGVADFVAWSKRRGDQLTKGEFYPTLQKSRLFRLGYIAHRSGHSRGSTMDLTIIRLPARPEPRFDPAGRQQPCHLPRAQRYLDNSLDMGTGYDCFHALSHTRNPAISGEARRNRALLLREMSRAGFENYRREWWHYTLRHEPYRKTYFDFPIVPRHKPRKPAAVPAHKTPKSALAKSALAKSVGQKIKLICLKPDELLTLYAKPATSAPVVAVFPSDQTGLRLLSCRGGIKLAAWHRLDPLARLARPPLWCRLGYAYSGHTQVSGWVDGRLILPLAASDSAARPYKQICPQR